MNVRSGQQGAACKPHRARGRYTVRMNTVVPIPAQFQKYSASSISRLMQPWLPGRPIVSGLKVPLVDDRRRVRVADRGGPHVHAAAAGAEIERGADDREPFIHAHRDSVFRKSPQLRDQSFSSVFDAWVGHSATEVRPCGG